MAKKYSPVPHGELRESIRLAASALLLEGKAATQSNLRARGIRGSHHRIGLVVKELAESGEISRTCLSVRPAHTTREKPARRHAWASLESYWAAVPRAWYRSVAT